MLRIAPARFTRTLATAGGRSLSTSRWALAPANSESSTASPTSTGPSGQSPTTPSASSSSAPSSSHSTSPSSPTPSGTAESSAHPSSHSRSAIFSPEYWTPPTYRARKVPVRKPKSQRTEAWRLDPWAIMGRTRHQQCLFTRVSFPKSFMLNLRPALVPPDADNVNASDTSATSLARAEVYLLPDRIEHPRFTPRRAGKGLNVVLRRATIEPLLGKSKSNKRFNYLAPGVKTSPLFLDHVEALLTRRVSQELELLRERIRSTKRGAHRPLVRPLSDAEIEQVEAGRLPSSANDRIIGVLDLTLHPEHPRDQPVGQLLSANAVDAGSDGVANAAQVDTAAPTAVPTDADTTNYAPFLHVHALFAGQAAHIVAQIHQVLATEAIAARLATEPRPESKPESQSEPTETKSDTTPETTRTESEANTDANAAPDTPAPSPHAKIDMANAAVETARADDAARLVAVVVPQEGRREYGVSLVIALWRAALWKGFGWDETRKAR